ncbi:hypothetical protein M2263_002594 [Providencia alcalifaciens]|nr:hypothetical protein [Providencia alcalifaciens]
MANCQQLTTEDPQKWEDIGAKVEQAIRILNLNCDRLCADRREVLKSYNQEVAKARKSNDHDGVRKLAERWFRKRWPSFFSTRCALLGQHAERYLKDNNYAG